MNVFKAFKLSAIAAVLVCTASAAFAAESEFSYAGYLRVGYAYTNGLYGYDGNFGLTGRDQGAQKWTGRLGKEANQQYLENTIMNTFTVEGGAWAKLFVTFTFESMNPGSDAQNANVENAKWVNTKSASSTPDFAMRNRQAYVEMGGLGFSPDTSFWVGRRFYHREDVHILDYYFLDFSGDGAGVENIAGKGISLAIMSQQLSHDEQNNAQIAKESDGTNAGIETASTVVAQYKNKFSFGTIRVDGAYSYRPENGKTEATNGQFVSAQYQPDKFFFFLPGNSSVTAQYARGANAENIWWGDRVTHMQDQGKDTNDKAYSYAGIATGLIQISDALAISPVVGFMNLHSVASRIVGGASSGEGDVMKIFAVVRPHYNINKNVAIEVEGGFYRLSCVHEIIGGAASAGWGQGMGLVKGQKSNWAAKITPAVVLTLDNGFWTRPALRLFASYEQVGEKVTDNAVTGYTSRCISYGFQVEAWW